MIYKEFSSPHSSQSPTQDSMRIAGPLSLPPKPPAPLSAPMCRQTHLTPCRRLFRGLRAEHTTSA